MADARNAPFYMPGVYVQVRPLSHATGFARRQVGRRPAITNHPSQVFPGILAGPYIAVMAQQRNVSLHSA